MALAEADKALFGAALDGIARAGFRLSSDKGAPQLAEFYVWSGGSDEKHSEHIPAIFLKADEAVEQWTDCVTARLKYPGGLTPAATFRFSEPPVLVKLNMTEHDGELGQRLSAVRYGVRSRIAILTLRKKIKKPARRKRAAKKRKGR